MIWTIGFLAVINMAIGYGLAIYLHGKGKILFRAPEVKMPRSSPTVQSVPASPETQPQSVAAELPQEVPAVVEQPTAEAETAIEPSLEVSDSAPSEVAEAAADSTVEDDISEADNQPSDAPESDGNDDNVLAGIEAFRSQLAKISKANAEEEAETPAEELAET